MSKRVLIYGRGNGLGHLRRTRNIALAMLDQEPDCSILIIADERSTPFFSPVKGIDYLKLPGAYQDKSYQWRGTTLDYDRAEFFKLRAALILRTFDEFQPDAVLVDCFPVGPGGDLKPMLDRAAHRNSPPRLYFGLRDIMDLSEVTRQGWAGLGAYEYFWHYDGVLIHGCQDIFDTDSYYRLSSVFRKVIFCNYVAPPLGEVPEELAIDESTLLVMGGSGLRAFPMEVIFAEAWADIRAAIPLQALLLTGPNMARKDREAIAARSARYPYQILEYTKDATPLIRQAAVVVSLGGYNSLVEILQWGKKALVVPKEEIVMEQDLRAEVFAERGLVQLLPRVDLKSESLARELVRLYHADDVPNPANLPSFDGAQRVARVLLGKV
ncbi:MAG: glycosyltransferase family protein [Dehalococcoidia bacterium]